MQLVVLADSASWLFRVARNRITDLFRKRRPELGSSDSLAISNAAADADDDLGLVGTSPPMQALRAMLRRVFAVVLVIVSVRMFMSL